MVWHIPCLHSHSPHEVENKIQKKIARFGRTTFSHPPELQVGYTKFKRKQQENILAQWWWQYIVSHTKFKRKQQVFVFVSFTPHSSLQTKFKRKQQAMDCLHDMFIYLEQATKFKRKQQAGCFPSRSRTCIARFDKIQKKIAS